MKGSIIIPAYNEEKKLPVLLEALKDQSELEIIVVCNGCYDNTYEAAKQYEPAIKVVNIKKGSKIGALNKGDELASFYPRVYLDADIVISPTDLVKICDYMEAYKLKAAGAYLNFNYANKPLGVKWYYHIWTQLPYVSNAHHVGSGLYALSKDGRECFSSFPNVISDDGYINMLFKPEEKLKIPHVVIQLDTPNNIWNLVKIKARANGGYRQLAKQRLVEKQAHNNKTSLLRVALISYKNVLPMCWYVMLQITIKLYGAFVYKQDTKVWLRDESSR